MDQLRVAPSLMKRKKWLWLPFIGILLGGVALMTLDWSKLAGFLCLISLVTQGIGSPSEANQTRITKVLGTITLAILLFLCGLIVYLDWNRTTGIAGNVVEAHWVVVWMLLCVGSLFVVRIWDVWTYATPRDVQKGVANV